MQRVALLIWATLVALILVSCGTVEISTVEPTPIQSEDLNGVTIPTRDDPQGPSPDTPVGQPTITIVNPTAVVVDANEPANDGEKPASTVTTVPINLPPTPTPPAPGIVGCVPRADWPEYTVESGETLGEIAAWSDSSINQLAAANCLANPNLLYADQVIRVPRLPVVPGASLSPTPAVLWSSYSSSRFQASFSYPANWKPVGDGGKVRFEGEGGWLEVGALASPWSLGEVASSQAEHKLQPFGSAPAIKRITLSDGRQARIIMPSADQNGPSNGYSLLIAPYAIVVKSDGVRMNYLTLAADVGHIEAIANTLAMTPPPNEIGIRFFMVDVVDMEDGGKRLTFNWDSFGATRGVIYSGTAERFAPWWPVEAGGQLTVDLDGTLFADPKMVLRVMNEVSQAESTFTVEIEWPCAHDYFFAPAPERCPQADPLAVTGAYQAFEGGFMVWLPAPNWTYPAIYVFQNDGRVRFFSDEWLAGQPDGEPGLEVPGGLFQPVRGFGKVWLGNPDLQETLGWATAPEFNYEVTYQAEARESLPGVAYLRLPDGRILHIVGFNWSDSGLVG